MFGKSIGILSGKHTSKMFVNDFYPFADETYPQTKINKPPYFFIVLKSKDSFVI